MLEKILQYEENLFFLINGTHSRFFDYFMWLFSGRAIWVPIGTLIIFTIVYKKSWKQWLLILIAITIVFTLCDQFSCHIMKPLFERPRPTRYPEIMEHVRTLYDYMGGRYGFVSGHATNSFGFATFSALLFKNKLYRIVIFLWAAIVSYSRVYLGVHFVSDIVGGMIFGIIIGFFVYKLYCLGEKKLSITTTYSIRRINIMSIIMICYVIIFSILGEDIVEFL